MKKFMLRKKDPLSCQVICEKTMFLFKTHGKNYFFDKLNCLELPSKKNYVIKTNIVFSPEKLDLRSVIIKFFNPERTDYLEAWQNEINFIKKAQNIFPVDSIPTIIDCITGIILYPYYDGLTYQNLLLKKNLSSDALTQLAKWIFIFHQNGFSLQDPRLQNFFYTSDNHLKVLDCEEFKMISIEGDIFEFLCAFIDLEPNYNITHDLYSVKKMVEFFALYKQIHKQTKRDPRYNLENLNTIVGQIMNALRKILDRRNEKLNQACWEKIASELYIAFNV